MVLHKNKDDRGRFQEIVDDLTDLSSDREVAIAVPKCLSISCRTVLAIEWLSLLRSQSSNCICPISTVDRISVMAILAAASNRESASSRSPKAFSAAA